MDPKSVWVTKFKVSIKTLTILREKLPKIIAHKWKLGNLLEAPNKLPMKGLFVIKFESNEGK